MITFNWRMITFKWRIYVRFTLIDWKQSVNEKDGWDWGPTRLKLRWARDGQRRPGLDNTPGQEARVRRVRSLEWFIQKCLPCEGVLLCERFPPLWSQHMEMSEATKRKKRYGPGAALLLGQKQSQEARFHSHLKLWQNKIFLSVWTELVNKMR